MLENQISRFRKGKTDLHANTLFAIVNALPAEARAFWFALVMITTEDCQGDRVADVGHQPSVD